jgi:hypothetical protein
MVPPRERAWVRAAQTEKVNSDVCTLALTRPRTISILRTKLGNVKARSQETDQLVAYGGDRRQTLNAASTPQGRTRLKLLRPGDAYEVTKRQRSATKRSVSSAAATKTTSGASDFLKTKSCTVNHTHAITTCLISDAYKVRRRAPYGRPIHLSVRQRRAGGSSGASGRSEEGGKR